MAKPNRGKNIRSLPFHGRGECPVCMRTGVKILYEHSAGDQKIKTCKVCRAAIKSGKKALPQAAEVPAAAAE